MALAPMIQELGGVVMPAQCLINYVSQKVTDSGELVEPESDVASAIRAKTERVVKQTAWYATAFNNQKAKFGELPSM